MIEQLLSGLPVSDFLENHYLRLPFAMREGAGQTLGFGRTDFLQLAAVQSHDVLIGRGSELWPGQQPTSPEGVESVLQDGYSVGLRKAHQLHPVLLAVAQSFWHDFCATVDVHAYLTPPGQVGFGWHYDAEEVFILQLAGSKTWKLRKNTVHPWPVLTSIPKDMHYERELMPLLECRLEEGGWLYIPAGYWHATSAHEESLSLSVGIASPSALDLLDFAKYELTQQVQWRQRLPSISQEDPAIPADTEPLRKAFEWLAEDLRTTLLSPRFVAKYVSHRRNSLCKPSLGAGAIE